MWPKASRKTKILETTTPRRWGQRPDLFLSKVKFFTALQTRETIQYFLLPRAASLYSSANCTNRLSSQLLLLSPCNGLSPVSSSNTISHYNQAFCSVTSSSFLFFYKHQTAKSYFFCLEWLHFTFKWLILRFSTQACFSPESLLWFPGKAPCETLP